jgi:hypothetical protein
MFSVDLPRSDDGHEVLADVVRIVASNEPTCVADHAVLLERRLPFGTAVGAGEQVTTAGWEVAVGPADADGRSIVTLGSGGGQVLRMWLTGSGP